MTVIVRRYMRAALMASVVAAAALTPPLASEGLAQMPGSGNILTLAKVCAECHGEGGNSADPRIPRLAGQKEQYLELQLQRFRKRISRELRPFQLSERLGHTMDLVTESMEDDDIKGIARYFAGLPCRNDPDRRPVPMPEVIIYCARCHGVDGKGADWLIPNLAGQSRGYMISELKLMHESTLGKNRELILDDVTGAKLAHYHRTMGRWATRISEAELNAAAEYYAGLPCN